VPVVLVSFGYAPAPLHEFAPDAVIDYFDELAPLLLERPLTRVNPS
jgi:phosphoglycolate phosphatase-like HAD superfamily hydrolase